MRAPSCACTSKRALSCWNTSSKRAFDLDRAEKILNRDHYGMEKVKARFLETLAVRKLSDQATGQIICLCRPAGRWQTSIARFYRRGDRRKYVRVSRRRARRSGTSWATAAPTSVSMPGRIMAAVKQAGTNNPSSCSMRSISSVRAFAGDPSASLLEVLDPEQNKRVSGPLHRPAVRPQPRAVCHHGKRRFRYSGSALRPHGRHYARQLHGGVKSSTSPRNIWCPSS